MKIELGEGRGNFLSTFVQDCLSVSKKASYGEFKHRFGISAFQLRVLIHC